MATRYDVLCEGCEVIHSGHDRDRAERIRQEHAHGRCFNLGHRVALVTLPSSGSTIRSGRMQEMGRRMAAAGTLSVAVALPGTAWRMRMLEEQGRREMREFEDAMRRTAAAFAGSAGALTRLRWALQRPERERRQVAAMRAWARRRGRRK